MVTIKRYVEYEPIKIPLLPAAIEITEPDLFIVEQDGVTKKATAAMLKLSDTDELNEGVANLYNRVPLGGASGEIMKKIDSEDFNIEWVKFGGSLAEAITTSGAETTPDDADIFGFIDVSDSNNIKQITWGEIKAALKTYFDTLYQPLT